MLKIFLFKICFIISKISSSSDEQRLLQDLFSRKDGGYNPRIRPVRNLSHIIDTGFEMALIQLINLDERNQIMKTNVWLRLHWCDYQFQWKKEDYGGIEIIRIQPDKVWKPDIVLYNNADGRFEVTFRANVLIFNSGFVMWIPCTIYKSSCSIDVTYFPFDEQICEMSFASWTYNSEEVDISWYLPTVNGTFYPSVDVTNYEKSGSWDLIDFPGEIVKKEDKTFVNYRLKLRRKTLFYTVNLIIPSFLISILTTAVFFLPADAGEKTTMSVSILLALVVFLQVLVTNLLPPSSTSFPLFAKYILFAVVLDVCAVVNTIFVLNWHYKTPRTHSMPSWIKKIFFGVLPKILLINRPSVAKEDDKYDKKLSLHQSHSCSQESFTISEKTRRSAIKPREFDFSDVHSPNCKYSIAAAANAVLKKRKRMKSDKNDNATTSKIEIMPEINKAVEAVRFISAHLKNEDDYEEVIDDWRFIAQVIDRILLYVYLLVTIITTLAILIKAPNVFQVVEQDVIKNRYKNLHNQMIYLTNDILYNVCDE